MKKITITVLTYDDTVDEVLQQLRELAASLAASIDTAYTYDVEEW
jgi:hypothetical protein